ncbi:S-adenosyl-L-methionine-dependent methyltransferases superfamily protein [Raphanus sativus]|nr:S-adenosyl-L-methionine-dependent methyltransferases superfamily protein [Raphanus sativus]
MGFSSSLVHRTIDENGIHNGMPMDEMLNFLAAAQLDEDSQQHLSDVEVPSQMDKTTSQLLEMGFSRQEISKAIQKIGKEAQISDLAELIITGEVPDGIEKKVSAIPSTSTRALPSKSQEKDCDDEGSSNGTAFKVGKRIKDEEDDFDNRGKRLRPGGSSSAPGMRQEESKESLSQILPSDVVDKRPYAFYGNIGELSPQTWSKISSFFFGIQPEHVDTRLCSPLRRKEGYMHNLPIENRFHILPNTSRTAPPSIITSPENLECLMGYPPNHTNIGGARSSSERLKLLDYCFQTDTLGYHLSVLKPMFPQGLRVLSLFSGIGGAEIALNRLGIHLKSVYSVEPCGLSRSVVKRWWQSSGQSGELEQIEDIRSLRGKKLETLVKRLGGFDLVICQNPPTPTDLSKESSRSQACKFDYTLFNEVVRVSKCVRGLMESS